MTLTPAQEPLVVELRRTLLLPLDDLLALTHEFINRDASRSGLDRCLRRHGVSNLQSLIPAVEGQEAPKTTFKDDEPGFLHVDIKYLPKMPDGASRRYLFVAIDRATRWVFFRTFRNQTLTSSSTDFLRLLQKAVPLAIKKILTDNGGQFTDRFTSKKKIPSGQRLAHEHPESAPVWRAALTAAVKAAHELNAAYARWRHHLAATGALPPPDLAT